MSDVVHSLLLSIEEGTENETEKKDTERNEKNQKKEISVEHK